MDRAGRQLFAGASFAANQDSGFRTSDPGDAFGDLAHLRTAADEAMLRPQCVLQKQILLLERLEMPRPIEGHTGELRNHRYEFQVIAVQRVREFCRVQVNRPNRLSVGDQWHDDNRAYAPFRQAAQIAELLIRRYVVAEDRGAVFYGRRNQGAAYRNGSDQFGLPVPAGNRRFPARTLGQQDNRSLFGGHNVHDLLQEIEFQCFGLAPGVQACANLQKAPSYFPA